MPLVRKSGNSQTWNGQNGKELIGRRRMRKNDSSQENR